MHLVTVKEPLQRGARLAPGTYLVDDKNAGEMLAAESRKISAQAWTNPKPISELFLMRASTAPRVLFIRAGAYGDLLFLAAAISIFKKQFPEASVTVCAFEDYATVLTNHPDVSGVLAYPPPQQVTEAFDVILPLENVVEDAKDVHAVDAFLAVMGVDTSQVSDDDKRCVFHPTDAELSAALATFPRRFSPGGSVIPRIGIQLAASEPSRTYPGPLMAEVFARLHGKAGWELYLFGSPKAIRYPDQERIVNLTHRALDFRRSAAVLTTCDVVLAPDSALAHLAGALDLPCVALYGSFPAELRTKYHPKTFALQGSGACSPCFHRGGVGDRFPSTGPCAQSHICDVLASITPGRVTAKVVALYQAAQKLSSNRT